LLDPHHIKKLTILTKTNPEKANALKITLIFCNIMLLSSKKSEDMNNSPTESITVVMILPKTFWKSELLSHLISLNSIGINKINKEVNRNTSAHIRASPLQLEYLISIKEKASIKRYIE
jgi:hypothetical protein